MPIDPGARVGPYEIVALIGRGGMGEVYRAHDARLRRDVAIKVIPASFATDPGRLQRFEREAVAAASLNHPNIVAVYDHGMVDGSPYLVMELLDGESLRSRLLDGALPLRKAVKVGVQIATGVAAAHDKGIVHRDLKPENIFVTRDERIKILDFGLAKMTESQPSSLPDLLTTPLLTDQGQVLGTAGYMAPEQVRGEPADPRSDVFAIGAVLYELLTGVRAFQRDTVPETLTAILHDEPRNVRELTRNVPSAIARLIARCLEKQPLDRFHSAHDLAFALEAMADDPSDVGLIGLAPTTSPRRRLWRAAAAGAAALGLVLAGFLAGRQVAPSEPSGPMAAPVTVSRLTDARGLEQFPAHSPDGKALAFVALADGNLHVFVRLLSGGGALRITRAAADHLHPRWSPDAASILLFSPEGEGSAAGTLWELPALGGPARRIAASVGGGDISHDGKRIAFPRSREGRMELVTTARDGSDAKSIARLEIGYYYSTFRWSPDDRVIAFQRGIPNEHEILVVPASGGQPRQITRNRDVLEGLTWAADGSRIVFSSSGTSTIFYLPPTNLWSVDVDGSHPTQLTFGEASYTYPDINATGTIIAVRVRREFDIWRYPVDGAPDENVRRGVRITDQTSHVQTPSVAPDDSEVIYVSDSGGHANLWASDLATGESRQVTFERDPATRVGLPLWSPDGRHIAYFMTHGSSYNYFLMNADGSNSRLLAGGAAWATWSPDGDWLYFSSYPDGQYLKRAPVEGGSAQIIRDDHATRPAISPDGTTLYYVVEQPVVSGGSDLELRVARPEGAPSRVLVRIPASRTESWQQLQPVVSPDGNWLAFNLADGVASNLWAVSTATAELRQLTDFGEQPMIITRRASWSSDGRSIFASVGEAESDIVMFEGLSP